MPTTRPYPVEHYPIQFLEALKAIVPAMDVWHVAGEYAGSKQAAGAHRKLNAMLAGFLHFPGQDAKLTELVKQGRVQVRKRWDARTRIVYLEVCSYRRPSEAAEALLASLRNSGK